MSLKEVFAPDEWVTVTEAPQLVATAVMMASFSGLGGTAKEAFSLAHSLAQAQTGTSALLKEITTSSEVSAAQTGLRTRVKELDQAQFKQELSELALNQARRATEAVNAKAPDELEAYKQWLMNSAFGVANASKEGDFLGFGGKRISDAEQKMLESLSAVLEVPIPSSAS